MLSEKRNAYKIKKKSQVKSSVACLAAITLQSAPECGLTLLLQLLVNYYKLHTYGTNNLPNSNNQAIKVSLHFMTCILHKTTCCS